MGLKIDKGRMSAGPPGMKLGPRDVRNDIERALGTCQGQRLLNFKASFEVTWLRFEGPLGDQLIGIMALRDYDDEPILGVASSQPSPAVLYELGMMSREEFEAQRDEDNEQRILAIEENELSELARLRIKYPDAAEAAIDVAGGVRQIRRCDCGQFERDGTGRCIGCGQLRAAHRILLEPCPTVVLDGQRERCGANHVDARGKCEGCGRQRL